MERIRRKPLNESFDDQESIEPCGYLSLKEYKRLVDRDTELTEKEFKKLLRKASALLDIQTRRFYQRNDLESDIPMRCNAFKLAIAYQIEYMHEVDATTTFGMQEPDSWSIGRMSVSKGKGSKEVSLLSGDAMLQLSGTGLLYRGVSR
ncbi:hypothetical protein K1Y38_27600 [Serratia marcescens]|uniref:hypothetical protein n=1 Tax=Enterococcus mundtii TaxID=53346 RepID=UPI002238DC97|nr:hypothetical protein [Enterococcus mundtii]MCW6016514.1 hypothetical protein [Serratia marcescens]MEC3942585.1 hypothetical protein [Enterococcus mundtii]